LLAFARRQPLQSTPTDIGALVKGLAGLIGSTVGARVLLTMDVADNLPPAKSDPNQLEMAILNLCSNARDAMDGIGHIRISVTAETVEMDGAVDLKPGNYVRLRIADTGRGMDEATRARAIEPFFSTKGVGKGTGLGLSMAHGLASQLGGCLTIESQPGAGTEISIWLPESSEAPPQHILGPRSEAAALRAGTVLVVDDEDFIRVSIAEMLTDLGFIVREAVSAEAALSAIEGGLRPDLLITDHLMPGMTGVELAYAVKAWQPSIEILIVSGFAEVEGIDPALPRLTKPFMQSDLIDALLSLKG
jgi:CheY-like chemotaxis protein/two-component sensor histidine kinase